jgi:ubiquinone biosynthesis protein COQ9
MKAAILTEALRLVPKYGWTRFSLEEACKLLDLPPTAHGLFPRGEVDLIAHFVDTSNAALAAKAGPMNESESMRDRLKRVTRERLAMVLPFEQSWSQALKTLALPSNALVGAQLLHSISDEILHVSGDQSTDLSWYSKRAGLSLAYAAAELHLLTDMNASKEDSWVFLNNRIDNFADAIQVCSQVTKINLKM